MDPEGQQSDQIQEIKTVRSKKSGALRSPMTLENEESRHKKIKLGVVVNIHGKYRIGHQLVVDETEVC